MNAREARAAADTLRAMLAEIDAGRVDATPAERAYMAGALDTLDRVFPPPQPRRRVRRTDG